MSASWFVAMTRPGYSFLAEAHLREQGFEVFNPKIKVERIRRGRRLAPLIRQYLPGYIFVRFDAATDCWYPVNWTRGVRRLISAAPDRPIPIRSLVIQLLQERCDGEFVIPCEADRALHWLQIGRTVRISKGAFEGRTGRISWTSGDRVRVILSFLGSTRPVEVHAAMLEAV